MADVADKKPDDNEAGDGAGQVEPFKAYLMPAKTYVIIEKEWVLFTLVTALVYCLHLVWMCYGVDAYSSYERHIICGDAKNIDDASAVYDTWILLCIIFHMVEWIRQTIFATSALVGVNLVGVFYALYVMVPYGIIVMLGGAIAAFGSDETCSEKQSSRSTFLKL